MPSRMSKLGDFLGRLAQLKKKKTKTRGGGERKKKRKEEIKNVSTKLLSGVSMLALLGGCSQTTRLGYISIALSVKWKLNISFSLYLS